MAQLSASYSCRHLFFSLSQVSSGVEVEGLADAIDSGAAKSLTSCKMVELKFRRWRLLVFTSSSVTLLLAEAWNKLLSSSPRGQSRFE